MNSAVSVFISQSGPRDYYGVSRMRSRYLLFGRDGVSSTVAVFGEAGGERWFTVNGKTDGGTGDLTPQVRLGMVPMLLNPAARRVAVVGLGTGVTAGTAGMFHGVESIDIVEIEPAVLEASRYFDAENAGILLDPRTRVHVDDGRSFLESRRASFDVVVSEPSNPWVAGVSNLYTAEFFRGVRGSLRPGGVFGQWVQIYNLSPESYRVIVRTFLDAFPDASLWQVGAGDTILIGRTGGGTLDPEAIRSRVRSSTALVERLGTNGDVPLGPLYESFLLGAGDLRTFAGEGPRNTDDLNRLEFDSPKSLYRQEIEPLLREIGRHRTRPSPDFLRLPGGEPGSPRTRSLP
jgi:spermidine synthase